MPRTAAIYFHFVHGGYIEFSGIRVKVPLWYLATSVLPTTVALYSGNHQVNTKIAISCYESDPRITTAPKTSYEEFRSSVLQGTRGTQTRAITPPLEREILSQIGPMKCFEFRDSDPLPTAWCMTDGALIVASFRGSEEKAREFYDIVKNLSRK
jgi:hypothetical protein